ncbi:Sulfur carrier protein ThiS (thiamine biosynthesis) [Paucidesulfovibrio gracilis DSM 16080]|uniref:Sulfur carrier protein ThiS (Thiamine biosynthesis) n=1 Tax=Paucidesulfovibrio gracilis DSM 16080 TaxID=1121449 RepID=A0A1T4Y1F0_9BACT|nr:MoaD/ThiS family protein [Paucidesulfovibrio gracilis]SKA95453.1 Sulfur carrier protein ThiS (thiamine biosynthesis) [Paucidesulfovibrio gracilis DSM 16080]
MHIELKCFATLSGFMPENAETYELSDGSTVRDVLAKLGIPEEDVKIIFINGTKQELHSPLSDGDRLGLFPAVGGG